MKYLSDAFIIARNSSFPDKFEAGKDNLLNPGTLDYLVEMVKDDRYCPSIYDKAAFYAYKIICGHVFNDGNKRTGISSMLFFLESNGASKPDDLTDDEIIDIALSLAENRIDREGLANWLRKKYRCRESL